MSASISASISSLGRIGELEAVRAEQLDAVVVIGIVRGGDHHAVIGAQRARQHGDARRRDRPEQEHVDADRGEAGDQRRSRSCSSESRVSLPMTTLLPVAVAIVQADRHADAHGDVRRHRMRVRPSRECRPCRNSAVSRRQSLRPSGQPRLMHRIMRDSLLVRCNQAEIIRPGAPAGPQDLSRMVSGARIKPAAAAPGRAPFSAAACRRSPGRRSRAAAGCPRSGPRAPAACPSGDP